MKNIAKSIITLIVMVSVVFPSFSEASTFDDVAYRLQGWYAALTLIPKGNVLGVSTSNLSYPSLQNTTGLENPSLAYGLNEVSDWSAEMPFIDMVKMGRSWIVHNKGQWGGGSTKGILDENGWPTSIPSGADSVSMIWDWSGGGYNSAKSRLGRYVLTYEGKGNVEVGGAASVVSQSNGKIVFDIEEEEMWSVDITKTNTSDYIRNISVVREAHVPLHEAGAIFNPDFLSVIKDVRQIRFMDWMNTNDSEVKTWSQYPSPDYYTWVKGVPVEVMTALANEVGADPWFTIPHQANDNYVKKFAQTVKTVYCFICIYHKKQNKNTHTHPV
jgi:hypothetical protein